MTENPAALTFEAVADTYELGAGRFRAWPIALPAEVWGFDVLVGHRVTIGGYTFTVASIERRQHDPPWKAGEIVALLEALPEPEAAA